MEILSLFNNLESLILSESQQLSEPNLVLRVIYILIAFLYIASCIYGDKMQKIILYGTGYLFGCFLGLLLGAAFHSNILSITGSIPLGMMFGYISYKLRRVGQALFIGFIPALIVSITINIIAGTIIFIVLLIVGALLSKLSITAVISLVSGVTASELIVLALPIPNNWIIVSILGAILALIGFVLQCISMAKTIRDSKKADNN